MENTATKEKETQHKENALGSLAVDILVAWDRKTKGEDSPYQAFGKTLVDRMGRKKIH